MNKTGIEWCDMTWNPVTGCLHGCPYCYAKQRVRRFEGYEANGVITTHNPLKVPTVLSEPLTTVSKFGVRRRAAFPFGFDPTLHGYRMEEPLHYKQPQDIFVCSMSDLFGDWVPDEWIEQVFDTCHKAPWHRYLFLTKNPKRYIQLEDAGMLLKGDNVWYGSTVTDPDTSYFWAEGYNTFLSVEPVLAPFKPEAGGLPNIGLIILGAETGYRNGKVAPEKEWVEPIVYYAKQTGTPVFMKDSMRSVWGDELITELPWRCGDV